MALIGPSSIPKRVFVDENGVWWRRFEDFDALIPTKPLPDGIPESGVAVATYALVPEHPVRAIVEGDPVDPPAIAEPPDDATLEEMEPGYEARWHKNHPEGSYVHQCADCRRERQRGLR